MLLRALGLQVVHCAALRRPSVDVALAKIHLVTNIMLKISRGVAINSSVRRQIPWKGESKMKAVRKNTTTIASFGAIALVAFSAVSATASDTPSIVVRQINSIAPEVSVSSLSHAEIASIMNAINSADGSSDLAYVKSLAKKYAEN